MSKKVEIELNRAGVKELLKGAEMQAVMNEHAQATLAGCGDAGYEAEPFVGKNRAGVRIHAATPYAYYDNLKNSTLLKALK